MTFILWLMILCLLLVVLTLLLRKYWSRLQMLIDEVHRIMLCPWCWQALHVMHLYPPHWSSSICQHHDRQLRARSAARRAARKRAAQPAPVLSPVSQELVTVAHSAHREEGTITLC